LVPSADPTREKGPSRQRDAATKPHTLSLSHGIERVALHMLAAELPVRFATYVDCQKPLAWSDLIEAAAEVCRELHIDTATWGDACIALGRKAAAVAVLLVDARTPLSGRGGEGGVSNPVAYLRAMTACGREGRLRLDASVFALASRGRRNKGRPADAVPGRANHRATVSERRRAPAIFLNPEVCP
jgi:hypothetical protein